MQIYTFLIFASEKKTIAKTYFMSLSLWLQAQYGVHIVVAKYEVIILKLSSEFSFWGF